MPGSSGFSGGGEFVGGGGTGVSVGGGGTGVSVGGGGTGVGVFVGVGVDVGSGENTAVNVVDSFTTNVYVVDKAIWLPNLSSQ